MYGRYTDEFKHETEEISLRFSRDNHLMRYRRVCPSGKEKKTVYSRDCVVRIEPVEPVSTPKELTKNLLIALRKPIVVAPRSKAEVFLTFPVEIGVFISEPGQRRETELLDVFSIARQKYTLYGDVTDGFLCKHYKSRVYSSMPETNPLREGVLELGINNRTATGPR